MGLLPDTLNRGLRMRRECWERFPRRQLQRKPLVSDPGMHHARSVMHVGSLTRGGGENVPGIPGAYETRNFTYLVRGPTYDCPNLANVDTTSQQDTTKREPSAMFGMSCSNYHWDGVSVTIAPEMSRT